jgi:hypothetical protein
MGSLIPMAVEPDWSLTVETDDRQNAVCEAGFPDDEFVQSGSGTNANFIIPPMVASEVKLRVHVEPSKLDSIIGGVPR